MTQIKLFKADDPWGDRMLEEQVNQFLQENVSTIKVINAIFSGKDELDYDQIKLDCQNESISRNSRGKVGF